MEKPSAPKKSGLLQARKEKQLNPPAKEGGTHYKETRYASHSETREAPKARLDDSLSRAPDVSKGYKKRCSSLTCKGYKMRSFSI